MSRDYVAFNAVPLSHLRAYAYEVLQEQRFAGILHRIKVRIDYGEKAGTADIRIWYYQEMLLESLKTPYDSREALTTIKEKIQGCLEAILAEELLTE